MMFSHNEPAGNFEVLGPWGSVPALTDGEAGTAGSYEFVVQTLGLEWAERMESAGDTPH
jgi:hypothetical protein